MTDPRPITVERLDANWRMINLELDAPRPPRIERALRAIGVPARMTRLVGATPAFRRAWFAAIVAVVLLGIGAADESDPRGSLFALLVTAPLLPVLGVGLAYGLTADPAHEVAVSSPMRGVRLLAVRTITVSVISIAIVLPLSVASEVVRPMAAAWLLPALATTSMTLALATRWSIRTSTFAAGGLWAVVAVVVRGASADPLSTFAPIGQVVSVGVAIVATAVVVVRRTSFDVLTSSDLAAAT